MTSKNNKIAIISASLGQGGAEKFAGNLSFILSNLNFEVHNIVINDIIAYKYSGKLLNLGILSQRNNFIVRKFIKAYELKKYLRDNNIDIIIENRTRNQFFRELITNFIFGKRRIIWMVHNYKLEHYFPKSKFLAHLLYKKNSEFVCVADAIKNKITENYNFKNTKTIYNSIDVEQFKNINLKVNNEKYILYFGRLENEVKNFDLLLEAFEDSKIFNQGFQLKIMGDGNDIKIIRNKIKKLDLDKFVNILPFQNNPFEVVKNAKFTILTSRHEGYPMSIIESLALGTPVVSVDCKSGPSEIIVNEFNGLLVENYNVNALSEAINSMINDFTLYNICKKNTVKSIEFLSLETITKQWKSILE